MQTLSPETQTALATYVKTAVTDTEISELLNESNRIARMNGTSLQTYLYLQQNTVNTVHHLALNAAVAEAAGISLCIGHMPRGVN